MHVFLIKIHKENRYQRKLLQRCCNFIISSAKNDHFSSKYNSWLKMLTLSVIINLCHLLGNIYCLFVHRWFVIKTQFSKTGSHFVFMCGKWTWLVKSFENDSISLSVPTLSSYCKFRSYHHATGSQGRSYIGEQEDHSVAVKRSGREAIVSCPVWEWILLYTKHCFF